MITKEKIIITSGSYDPLSEEDLKFLKWCKSKGNLLLVGIHSDFWLQHIQGGFVQNIGTRMDIIQNLRCVDEVFSFNDMDGTVIQLLQIIKYVYPNADLKYVSNVDMTGFPELKTKGVKFEYPNIPKDF
jgi:bifunctional ADP-heptose synthase (sugar kinase/adenylyltransferase)